MDTPGAGNEAETAPKIDTPGAQSVAKAFSGAALSAERSGYANLLALPKFRRDILRADVIHIAEILNRTPTLTPAPDGGTT